MKSSILETIGKLLRQAEGTDNEAEAEAFTAKAQMLATQNQVDLAVARQTVAKREQREEPVQKSIYWGSELGTKNTKAHLVNLFSSVAGSNDVKLNIFGNSSGVIAFGFPSDIEVVETLFASLAIQMVDAGNAYLRKGDYKKETEFRAVRKRDAWGYWDTDYVQKPVDGRTARASFYEGFSSAVSSRLRKARREAAEAEVTLTRVDEVSGETVTEQSTGALVLVSKGVEVQDFYKATSRARGSWKGSSSSHHSSSNGAGHSAGTRARLSSQTAIGGSRTAIG